MRSAPLRSLFVLTACTLLVSALAQAQSTDSAQSTARTALFARCGGIESDTLPTGIRPGIYRGTLGTQPVTLELTASSAQQISDDPEQFHADRYSYDRYGPDIVLERGRAANRTAGYALLAVEAVNDFSELSPRGCLELSAQGQTLKGQWRSPDGKKRLAVTLSRVNVAALPLALPSSPGLLKLRQGDPFTFLRLNHAWVRVPGGLQEPLTGVTYPRVAGGTSALNAALQDHQLVMAGNALDCRGGSGIGLNQQSGTDFSGTGNLSFNRARLVSVLEVVSYYCGGAHPDSYQAGYTFDVGTGRNVRLAGQPGAVWPALNNQQLYAFYRNLYIESSEPDCTELLETSMDETYDHFSQHLTPAGLVIFPNWVPHVGQACVGELTLPYASIRKFADPRGAYFRTVYP